MNKLTAEKCRERIKRFKRLKKQFGIAMETELSLQAYEIALPMLEQQEKGNDGWIEWKGGECPFSSETEVEVRMRDGYVGVAAADTFRWNLAVRDQFPAADIIAYRVIENDGR